MPFQGNLTLHKSPKKPKSKSGIPASSKPGDESKISRDSWTDTTLALPQRIATLATILFEDMIIKGFTGNHTLENINAVGVMAATRLLGGQMENKEAMKTFGLKDEDKLGRAYGQLYLGRHNMVFSDKIEWYSLKLLPPTEGLVKAVLEQGFGSIDILASVARAEPIIELQY